VNITFLCLLVLQTAVVTAVALVITSQLAKRNHAILGVVLAIAVIALAELFMQWTVTANIQDCLQRACAAAVQPSDCYAAEFGCSEWSGMSRFVYFAGGVVDLVAYLIGGVMLFLSRRRKRNHLATQEPEAVDEGE
jgi:hypothetical protein